MTDQYDVIIVGAGFGGIGAAIQLKRLGFQNFVLLDREDDLAEPGVNHYPGLAVDVPTTTYSYFFEPIQVVAAVLHRRRNQTVRR